MNLLLAINRDRKTTCIMVCISQFILVCCCRCCCWHHVDDSLPNSAIRMILRVTLCSFTPYEPLRAGHPQPRLGVLCGPRDLSSRWQNCQVRFPGVLHPPISSPHVALFHLRCVENESPHALNEDAYVCALFLTRKLNGNMFMIFIFSNSLSLLFVAGTFRILWLSNRIECTTKFKLLEAFRHNLRILSLKSFQWPC